METTKSVSASDFVVVVVVVANDRRTTNFDRWSPSSTGAPLLFGAARGQGALRQLGRRKVPHPPTAAPAAAARQRGASCT